MRPWALGAVVAGAVAVVSGACDRRAVPARGVAPTISVRLPRAPSGEAAPPAPAADTALTAGAVEVQGIDRRTLRALAARAPSEARWRTAFRVTVDAETQSGGAGPPHPVIGRYDASSERVRFVPRLPFQPGVRYRVELDPRSLAALAGVPAGDATAVVEHRFAIAARPLPRTTRVAAVHPSGARVPSNLLRLYVAFSAPMEPGEAYDHIRLFDEAGREVRGAFLRLDEELWDPARRRLTVLLDPGRVKRGIRSNLEAGAPLVPGRRYRLSVDATWRDASGARLAESFEYRFEAAAPDRARVDPAAWRLSVPRAGTLDSIHADFGKALDHVLAGRTLAVYDRRGDPVSGAGRLDADDRGWAFAPRKAWEAATYTLRVWPELEDVAGNRVSRKFDADRAAGDADFQASSAAAGVRLVPFRPSSAPAADLTIR